LGTRNEVEFFDMEILSSNTYEILEHNLINSLGVPRDMYEMTCQLGCDGDFLQLPPWFLQELFVRLDKPKVNWARDGF
jgi:hypothetical protein